MAVELVKMLAAIARQDDVKSLRDIATDLAKSLYLVTAHQRGPDNYSVRIDGNEIMSGARGEAERRRPVMADEYRPEVGDRVAVVGEVTDVGVIGSWVKVALAPGYGCCTAVVPLEAVRPDPTAELEALRARVAELEGAAEEREADMHMRIRADYDRTVADSWRAANARVTAERDQALARIAEPEGAATKPAEPAVTIHMQSRAKPLELHGHHVHTCPECHEDLPCEQTCAGPMPRVDRSRFATLGRTRDE